VHLSLTYRSAIAKVALALAVGAAIFLLTQEHLLPISFLQRLELATLDYRFQSRGTDSLVQASPDIVIVEISEESFRSLPEKFPWPRSYYAHAIRNLSAAGARVIGIDLIFSGPDDHSPANDSALSAALRTFPNVVLAGKREEDQSYVRIRSASENFGNIFFDPATPLGLVNIRPDADGIYRLYNTAYVIDTPGGNEARVPTFAFAVLNCLQDLPPSTTPEPSDGYFTYQGRRIPQYDPASLLVNYYGPSRTFPYINFDDLIDDSTFTTLDERTTGSEINTFSDPDYGYLHDGTFRDKIVLIGVTIPEYKDLFPVSVGHGRQKGDNLMYGVEIHANVIESVLRGEFLEKQSPLSQALLVLTLTLLTFFVTSFLKDIRLRSGLLVELASALFAVVAVVGAGYVALVLFTEQRYLLHLTSAVLAVIGGYGASTVYHLVTERKQRLLIKSMFSTYVNASLVEELVAHPETLVLGGRREELTVLFSDIEGFTTISQDMPPERLVALLNEYLSEMSGIIFQHDGTVDKYEGDAIMAFWGAPIPQKDHALRACLSALEMQRAVAEMNARWQDEGKPPLRIRVGVNTGPMIVGNMGATGKFNYTVIGDSVNLASRLEGANKEYHTGLMVSEATYRLVCDRIVGRELGRIAVKGRSAPVTTYELIALTEDAASVHLREFLSRYADAMTLYYARKWNPSARLFRQALRLRPGDYPTQLHLAHIKSFQIQPPPPDWDGVLVMQTK